MSKLLRHEQLLMEVNALQQRLTKLEEEEQVIRQKICQKHEHVFSPTNFEYLYDTPRPRLFAGKHAMYEVTKRCLCCGFITQDTQRLSVKYVQNAQEAHLPDEIQQELDEALSSITSHRKDITSKIHRKQVQLCALSW